ncbi:hypothetical protein Tco_0363841 [Tanacetum coccineum]
MDITVISPATTLDCSNGRFHISRDRYTTDTIKLTNSCGPNIQTEEDLARANTSVGVNIAQNNEAFSTIDRMEATINNGQNNGIGENCRREMNDQEMMGDEDETNLWSRSVCTSWRGSKRQECKQKKKHKLAKMVARRQREVVDDAIGKGTEHKTESVKGCCSTTVIDLFSSVGCCKMEGKPRRPVAPLDTYRRNGMVPGNQERKFQRCQIGK